MNFFQSLKKSFGHSSSTDDLEKLAAREQKVFKFATLASATKGFHPTHKLGEGGFGPVYKGRLQDGREIAVKKLAQESRQGKREFINEAKLLARVQHRNVVNLLGYCTHEDDKLLVYEYVPHESLDKILFKSNRRMELDWKRRFEIICGIGRGLLYLHEDAPSTIIHRDIKASNILLDEKWVPKIADFGMARLFPDDETHVNTRIAGTNGYMAPEYVMSGRLSAKADVFSFGVLVLELISGHKSSTFSLDVEEQSLLEWAYKLYKKDNSLEILDSSILASAEPEQVKMCIQIGLLCTQYDPQLRPAMSRVVVLLSRKPGHLEEPTRPRTYGSMYQRSNLPSSTTTSGRSRLPHSSGSSLNTTTATATGTGSGSSSGSDRKDRWDRDRRSRHGKRQMWSY